MTPEEVLKKYKRVAVVGISPDHERPSYEVSAFLQTRGYQIQPVRPGGETILGIKCSENLKDLKGQLEIVDVFRRSDAVPEIVDDAIACGAKVIWLQEGVMNPVAEEKARKHGLVVFSDLCIAKVLARIK